MRLSTELASTPNTPTAFSVMFNKAFKILGLEDAVISNYIGANRTTIERWKNGDAPPKPTRRGVLNWLMVLALKKGM